MSIVKTKQALQDALGDKYSVVSCTMGYLMPQHDQVFSVVVSYEGNTIEEQEIVSPSESITTAMVRLANRIKDKP